MSELWSLVSGNKKKIGIRLINLISRSPNHPVKNGDAQIFLMKDNDYKDS